MKSGSVRYPGQTLHFLVSCIVNQLRQGNEGRMAVTVAWCQYRICQLCQGD